MEQKKKYYHAYDERYQVIHSRHATWAGKQPTAIIKEILERDGISKDQSILEIGCGEGRDSIALLKNGYSLFATDVSEEAIRYCKTNFPEYASHFGILDACQLAVNIGTYDFIFASSVLHMLVEEEDRNRFLAFIHHHLDNNGKALILTMGNGIDEFQTDPSKAFDIVERDNNVNHIPVYVPGTTCRMVSFETLYQELDRAGFRMIESGITECLPDFAELMYVLFEKKHPEII